MLIISGSGGSGMVGVGLAWVFTWKIGVSVVGGVVSRGLLPGWYMLCYIFGLGMEGTRRIWLRGDVDGDIICGIGI